MSADSPRRAVHKEAQVISPQPIVDRSIIDSVAGIINDIVPQAYTGTPNCDNKESISWARFEYADVNDPAFYPDYNEGSSTPPLLLVLGYATGVQVWLIAATGEATEVLSWHQGVVRILRIIPSPKIDDERVDLFAQKRPMVAICDSAGPGPQFCNVNFVSLKTGEQTKSIKFKSPANDVLANKRFVVVTFLERIAVFDARTLDDILSITVCYASPGPNPNPVALGTRWLAYSEKKLLPSRRSSGGCEGDGVQSYTATVLYAAKSLGKGLRGLGETVASSLTGNTVQPVTINNMGNDVTQPGVVTILDLQAAKEEKELDDPNIETIVAHFTAHSDAIVAMTFDVTGALLMTADRRGHDFHVFRIQPHPGGPTLAAVHHLYVLHRGDTTAKVQDMVFSSDTRWAAISTVRGTTHVFPVAPYGGSVGVRTHSTPHVVNRLSRFHRSAGLTDDGTRSHSPVSHAELPLSVYPYSNPRLPPYPHPTILHPLAQIRQPSSLNHAHNQSQTSRPQQRQRLHSDDSGALPLKICACFAPPRAWMYAQRDSSSKATKRAVDSLFVMACHGNMIQYDLEPKPAAGVPKEKVCDDTMIELEVEVKGQWPLLRSPNSAEIVQPLPPSSPLLCATTVPESSQQMDSAEDRWLSQVEIVTHAGPHRRLWMGPQFVFKTYNAPSGVAVNLVEAEAVEIGVTGASRPARSNPVNMPHAASRPLVPVVIDGSGSSYEQSPRFMEAYGDALDNENMAVGSGENQLREDLAEAMLETSVTPHRAPGRRSVVERVGQPVTKVVNPLGTVITVSADEEDVGSSQELDSIAENLIPEPPRSVCAEEGPASLGDLQPESQILREHTEICAEMRSASEPAIDSVPDDSIREVKEKRAICAEMAAAKTDRRNSMDFEREEAFRDVPSSLSLCAEKGEIPSSPMTQAKEHAWSRNHGKREPDVDLHQRNIAMAKYVVNYDEHSVVLMENRSVSAQAEDNASSATQKSDNLPAVGKKSAAPDGSCKTIGKNSSSGQAQSKRESKTRIDKYTVEEHEDSVVIEEAKVRSSKNSGKKKNCSGKVGRNNNPDAKIDAVGAHGTSKIARAKPCDVEERECKVLRDKEHPPRVVATKDGTIEGQSLRNSTDVIGSFVELQRADGREEETKVRKVESESCGIPIPEAQTFDDFSTIDYHVVETTACPTILSNQSDDDIEHIQSSELAQIREAEEKHFERIGPSIVSSETSSPARRKSSKSTISDDDLEYIQKSELAESVDREEMVAVNRQREKTERDGKKSSRKIGKHVLSSDDDLEHVQHSDVCEAEHAVVDAENVPLFAKKLREAPAEQISKTKNSRKKKDTVAIESESSETEMTVITKPREQWLKGKTPERETSEDIDVVVEEKDEEKIEETSNDSPARKSKGKISKTVAGSQKSCPTSAIEIIDIDAMQKAEMKESNETPQVPELKILSPRHETRSRKIRKNRKTTTDVSAEGTCLELSSSHKSSKARMAELQEAAEELLVDSKWQDSQSVQPTVEFSWSSIVKKKNTAENDARKDNDLETLLEIEEKSDYTDTKAPEVDDLDRQTISPLTGKIIQEEEIVPSDKGKTSQAETTDETAKRRVARTKKEKKNVEIGAKRNWGQKIPGNVGLDDEDSSSAQKSVDLQIPDAPGDSKSSKENSPEAEREVESEKRSDSEQEVVQERSSSSDEINANVATIDAEEDFSQREISDKNNVGNGTTTGASALPKKSNKFKKKKRR